MKWYIQMNKLFQLEHLLNTHQGSSIIYVRNRRATTDIHNYLSAKGFSTTFYHGGITNKRKARAFIPMD